MLSVILTTAFIIVLIAGALGLVVFIKEWRSLAYVANPNNLANPKNLDDRHLRVRMNSLIAQIYRYPHHPSAPDWNYERLAIAEELEMRQLSADAHALWQAEQNPAAHTNIK